MNKKIFLASAVALSTAFSFAGDFDTWFGDAGDPQVMTGLDNGQGTSGYWFSYSDSKDGGASAITWPASLVTDYSDEAMDNVVAVCGGICGDVTLSAGTITYDPFVGIGFNIAGEHEKDVNPTPDPADATAWGGVCIAYDSELVPSLELGLGDTEDKNLAYDNPFVKLPKGTGIVKNLAWEDFNQAGWGVKQNPPGVAITSLEAAAKLVAIKFKIQAKDGSAGHFNIMSVGPYNGGCAATEVAIKGVRAASSAKAILSGRTLSFAGVSSAASVEVISLQGQIMMKSSIDAASTLDLQSLQSGVYMVRVAGKSVDFTNKIVLK